jgi:hypothetical protein
MPAKPPEWPMPFKVFLRKIIGEKMASARTEKIRIRFFTEFLQWWREILLDPLDRQHSWVQIFTWPRMLKGDWTPEQIIAERQRDGFAYNEVDAWATLFGMGWMPGRFKRRAKIGAKARWNPLKVKKRIKTQKCGKKSSSIPKSSSSI